MLALRMATEYPWNGSVSITVAETSGGEWTLRLRVPGWCERYRLAIAGTPVEQAVGPDGYLALTRDWRSGDTIVLDLELAPALIAPHPRLDAVRSCLALQRGPLVYCLESHDQPAGVDLLDVALDPHAPLHADWNPDLFGGAMLLRAGGWALDPGGWDGQLYRPLNHGDAPPGRPLTLTAIPYYTWANRGPSSMRVWIPRAAHDGL
jgi:uncharacterized protein